MIVLSFLFGGMVFVANINHKWIINIIKFLTKWDSKEVPFVEKIPQVKKKKKK